MLHGGEIYTDINVEYDFSVNVNPLGTPEHVKRRVAEAVLGSPSVLEIYPDLDCTALRAALKNYTGLPSAQILCGNGASELILAAVQALRPRRILLTAPSFSGYRHAADAAGAGILYHMLRREEEFALTERYTEDLKTLRPDMAILCNPANPVGNIIEPGLLAEIVGTCRELGIWLLVDECFIGFLKNGNERSCTEFLKKENSPQTCDSLLVLDAFTKHFAMPGIRLGYLMAADPAVLAKIQAQQPEWSVSGPAQAAGMAALDHMGYAAYADKAFPAGPEKNGEQHSRMRLEAESLYFRTSEKIISEERKRMSEALSGLGFHVYPGEANYIFFSDPRILSDGHRPDLQKELLEKHRILIRSCDNYVGLQKGDYRVAVLTPEKNNILLKALRDVI